MHDKEGDAQISSENTRFFFFSFKLAIYVQSLEYFTVFSPLVKSAGASRWLKSTLCIVAENIYSTLFRTE